MRNACLIIAALVLAGCDPLGRKKCAELMAPTLALQFEINQAEAAAQKPDAAAFEAALAKVEARAVEARAVSLGGNDKFRAQTAEMTRLELLEALEPMVAALKVLNAKVVANENAEQIRAAGSRAAMLIDTSVGRVRIAKCDG